MNKKALILMTTYNGEKYISRQVDSIINQTFEEWKLIIRDDGSTDGTIDLLKDYADAESRISLLLNETQDHGAYLNFWTLIHEARNHYADYDYYFFSDQDDIWENSKLETMINEAERLQEKKPLLLYGDMRVIDQNDQVTYESINEVMGIGQMSGYSLFFTHGYLWGCDICVNQALFTSLPLLTLDHPHMDIMSHDNYMGKYALLAGKIVYLDEVVINHRRHNDNTTASYNMKLSPLKVFKRAVVQFDDLAKTHARVYNQTLVAFSVFEASQLPLKKHKKRVIRNVETAILHGGFTGIRILKKYKVKRKQFVRTIGIYMIMFLKRYKKYLIQ